MVYNSSARIKQLEAINMGEKTCGDCDNYDFDTHKCDLNDEPKKASESCESFRNSKSDDYFYFGES